MSGQNCPDVFERNDGDFILVGKLAYLRKGEWDQLRELGMAQGDDEALFIVPRQCMIDAARQIIGEMMPDADAGSSH